MFFSKIKQRIKLITDNLSLEEIKKKRKELTEELYNPEDFDLPSYTFNTYEEDGIKNYSYTTELWTETKPLYIKTIIIEKEDESLVLFQVNNTCDKLESQTTKTTINIIAIVSLNFLNYVSICTKDPLTVAFIADNESLAKIDNMLLTLCTKMYPFITFKRKIR